MTLPIRQLPTPPTRQDPASFYDRADAFVAALPAMTEDINEALGAVNAGVTAANGAQAAAARSAAASAESARQADAGILEILRRMPDADAILAELAKNKTVSPPVVVTAYGADADVVRDNDFSGAKWSCIDCSVRDLGDGRWGLRADNTPGGNPHIVRQIGGLVYGQWYTASVDVRFGADVVDGVVLWARDGSDFTMASASIGPGDGWRTLSVSFRMAAHGGMLRLIIDPGAMQPGKELEIRSLRAARGGLFGAPVAGDNRLGYPLKTGVSVAYTNYAELGRLPAPDGTPTAVRVGQQNAGENAYITWIAPGVMHDKTPMTCSIWIKPILAGDFKLVLRTDTGQVIADGQFADLPVGQWSRLTLRGVFADAQGSAVHMFIDSLQDTVPGRRMEFAYWGLALEPDWSSTPFASLSARAINNIVVGGHVVIDGPGAAAIFGPTRAVPGDVLWITVANGRNDNVLWGGGLPVMGRDETLQLDLGDGTYRFVYIDTQRGWWIA